MCCVVHVCFHKLFSWYVFFFSLEKRYIVNYSLKMVACTLLIEITKFCREPPPTFLPASLPIANMNRSISTQSQERKPSNNSVLSSDSDTNPSPTPSFSQSRTRQGSLDYYRKGSSPLLEDVPRFLSTDHPPSPNTNARVSMYLRVNSRHGKKHPRTQSHTTQSASRNKPHTSQMEIPADTFRVISSNPPLKGTRRMSVSAAAFLNQSQLNPADSHVSGASIRHRGRPSVAINANVLRRKSVSGSVLKSTNSRKENSSPVLSHTEVNARGSIQATITPPSSHRLNSPQGVRRRPSVLGRVFQRGRQIAQRGRRPANQSEGSGGRNRVSTTTNTSSATSSPCLNHQHSMSTAKADALYSNTLEDIKSHFPWLDVVEHMIVSFYSTSTELQERRKKSCYELMVALRYIFSLKFEKEKSEPAPTGVASNQSPVRAFSVVEATLTTAFTSAALIPDIKPNSSTSSSNGSRTMGSIIRQAPPKSASSSKEMMKALGKLDFSGVRLRRFLESGVTWGSKLEGDLSLTDILGDDNEMLHTSIDYLLEIDSSLSLEGILDSFNSTRSQYVSTFFAGLLHTPFSLLTYAAPVLPASTFRDLQESSWMALCDQDYEYADAAGLHLCPLIHSCMTVECTAFYTIVYSTCTCLYIN